MLVRVTCLIGKVKAVIENSRMPTEHALIVPRQAMQAAFDTHESARGGLDSQLDFLVKKRETAVMRVPVEFCAADRSDSPPRRSAWSPARSGPVHEWH
jgi:hypothetical protein